MSDPAPEFRCRPFVSFGRLGDMTRPRLFCYPDGDKTNAVVNLGIRVSAESVDDLFTLGLDLSIPPRLFWLLDLAGQARRIVRGRRS